MSTALSLLWWAAAWAAPPPYCANADVLRAQMQGCATNYLVLYASDHCVKGLDAAVAAAQKELGGVLAGIGQGGVASQLGHLDNSFADLAAARTRLAALLSEAERARAELARYPDALAMPGGLPRSSPGAAGFLKVTCVKDSLAVLRFDLAGVDRRVADLRGAHGEAVAVQGRTGNAMARLDEVGRDASGAVLVGARKARGGSTVTGEIEGRALASGPAPKPARAADFSLAPGSATDPGSSITAAGAAAPADSAGHYPKPSHAETAQMEATRKALALAAGQNEEEARREAEKLVAASQGEAAGAVLNSPSVTAAASPESSLERVGTLGESPGAVRGNNEAADLLDPRDLFQCVHSAYERAQKIERTR